MLTSQFLVVKNRSNMRFSLTIPKDGFGLGKPPTRVSRCGVKGKTFIWVPETRRRFSVWVQRSWSARASGECLGERRLALLKWECSQNWVYSSLQYIVKHKFEILQYTVTALSARYFCQALHYFSTGYFEFDYQNRFRTDFFQKADNQ